jgi:hypothetical protein
LAEVKTGVKELFLQVLEHLWLLIGQLLAAFHLLHPAELMQAAFEQGKHYKEYIF